MPSSGGFVWAEPPQGDVITIGYTQYFPQYRDFTNAEWLLIMADVERLLDASPVPLEDIAVGDEYIAFNGAGDDAYEDFYVPRLLTRQPSYEKGRLEEYAYLFTKTGRRPYDMVVVAALLIIDHHAPGVLKIASDGWRHEWEPGRLLATLVLNAPVKIPDTIRVTPAA